PLLRSLAGHLGILLPASVKSPLEGGSRRILAFLTSGLLGIEWHDAERRRANDIHAAPALAAEGIIPKPLPGALALGEPNSAAPVRLDRLLFSASGAGECFFWGLHGITLRTARNTIHPAR